LVDLEHIDSVRLAFGNDVRDRDPHHLADVDAVLLRTETAYASSV